MGMKQILVMMAAVVNLSVMADEVVFKERAIGDALAEQLKKPAGKFLPPPQFTKTELEKITKLDIGSANITDAGLKELVKLQELKSLVLYGNRITDVGLRELVMLQELELLNLELNRITDAGVKELAKLPKLKTLNLNSNRITDAGLKELAKLQNLKWLTLTKTQITDSGLAELAKLQGLELFWAFGIEKITKEGSVELQKALPNCHIRTSTYTTPLKNMLKNR